MLQAVNLAPAKWGASSRFSEPVILGFLRATECCAVLAAGLLASATRFSAPEYLSAPESYALITGVLLFANVFQFAGLYGVGRLETVPIRPGRLLAAWVLVMLLLVTLGFATKTAHQASRLWVGLWFIYGLVGLCAVRLLFKLLVGRWQRGGRLARNVVVAGAGAHGRRLVEHLRRSGDRSVRLVGLFDDRRDRVPDYVGGYPVLGTIDDLCRFARDNPIDLVVVALPWRSDKLLAAWMRKLRNLPVDVCLCPGVVRLPLVHRQLTYVGGAPLLSVVERPLSGWSYVVKALEDRLLAALILILAAPPMLLIALLIRLDSPGPALFRQKRYGFNNEVIEVFKFRTMRVDAAQPGEGEVRQAVRDDPRVTRVGRILRRTSLDELPQLLNVLRGEMSVVGPRPHAVAHNEQYAQLIDAYLARHRVKPGITGWAQVNGLRGETTTLDKMERRVQHDLYYIENWSLGFDLRILARTLIVGFAHRNAY